MVNGAADRAGSVRNGKKLTHRANYCRDTSGVHRLDWCVVRRLGEAMPQDKLPLRVYARHPSLSVSAEVLALGRDPFTGRLRVAEEGDLRAIRRAGDDVEVVRRGAQKDVPDALVGHPRARSIVRDLRWV